MQVTTETIRSAHAREVHPSQSLVRWTDTELNRPIEEPGGYVADPETPYALLICYTDGYVQFLTETEADRVCLDAMTISEHAGVASTQVHATPDTRKPHFVFMCGELVATYRDFEA